MPRIGFSVYLVTDREHTRGRALEDILTEACDAGIRAVQVRERDLDGRALLSLTERVVAIVHDRGGRVLVNDRIDVALAAGADGVHLRANSLPVAVARKLIGADRLLGVSTHTIDEAAKAEGDGADFVLLGPVYDTPSKREFGAPLGLGAIAEAARRVRIPVFAIGGVTVERALDVMRGGAAGVAVIGAILSAPDVSRAARALLDATSLRL
ncbi:MAG TPA: thiamine phosphate synthase [Nitrospirales bacterium]|nr:thiamine phosphate synthase [Nitrospirales bacterium]